MDALAAIETAREELRDDLIADRDEWLARIRTKKDDMQSRIRPVFIASGKRDTSHSPP